MEKDVAPLKEQLAQALFDHIPVGVGSQGIIPTTMSDLEAALELGMDYSIREAKPTLRLATFAALDPGNQSPTFPEVSVARLNVLHRAMHGRRTRSTARSMAAC